MSFLILLTACWTWMIPPTLESSNKIAIDKEPIVFDLPCDAKLKDIDINSKIFKKEPELWILLTVFNPNDRPQAYVYTFEDKSYIFLESNCPITPY